MKLKLLSVFVVLTLNVYAQIDQAFFFGKTSVVNSNILEPGQLSGHTYGKWHFSHDQLINYMKYLSNSSDKIEMIEYGRTHENRPLYHMIISSAENIKNLEELRTNHLDYIYSKNSLKSEDIPIVLWLGYSVHGNESSGGNASMLTAYYLISSEEEEVRNILEKTIIIIDPCLNPDGFNRAANWVNIHQSEQNISDLSSVQFNESWPGGRTNHYWFDLNRDWLLAQHPESQSRLVEYYKWRPAVVTDHHEMGSSGTFFFQPGVPSRTNPLTPSKNYDLTYKIGQYHSKALDHIGTLYFSEEVFDDYYYGKGSSYPDASGSIGILFEQARVNGWAVDNPHGLTTFAEAIRNQFTVSLSTINAALEQKEEIQNYQREFHQQSMQLASNEEVKAYVVGSKEDPVKLTYFLQLLNSHQIDIYRNNEPVQINGLNYKKNEAFVVPVKQLQYRLIKSIFETNLEFEDSVFYDLSTWTMPLAFNLDYNPVKRLNDVLGERVKDFNLVEGKLSLKSEIGYLFKWSNYNSPKVLYEILDLGINAKVATKSLQAKMEDDIKNFPQGSIFIPVQKQDFSSDELYNQLKKIAKENGVQVFGLESGFRHSGSHLGSSNFVPLMKPKILMIVGEGINSREAGEIWHLLDHRMKIPVTRVNQSDLNRVDLFEYTNIIMPSGRIYFNQSFRGKMEVWLKEGGVITSIGSSAEELKQNSWIDLKTRNLQNSDSISRKPYESVADSWRQNRINGVILNAEIDITHPIGFGYSEGTIPVFKNNNFVIEKDKNPFSSPVYLSENILLSGYLNSSSQQHIENSVYVSTYSFGRGNVIVFADNPNFRGFWYGTNKLFLNSIFFGQIIR